VSSQAEGYKQCESLYERNFVKHILVKRGLSSTIHANMKHKCIQTSRSIPEVMYCLEPRHVSACVADTLLGELC
jgi:hypothetical protein